MTENAQNEQRNGVFITIPAKISARQESVRAFDVPDPTSGDTTHLVDVTLPYGTRANGQDVSFYRTVILASQLDPGGQRFHNTHSILLPERNLKTGEPWNVKLTRDFGSYGENGEWNPNIREVNISSREFQTVMREQYEQYKQYRSEHRQETQAMEEGLGGADLDAVANETREGLGEPASPSPDRAYSVQPSLE